MPTLTGEAFVPAEAAEQLSSAPTLERDRQTHTAKQSTAKWRAAARLLEVARDFAMGKG